jgi:hypothetical protein
MKKIAVAIRGVFVVAALSSTIALAQSPAPLVAGPVPSAIKAAKKIFISNGGADSGLFPHPFSGDPNRAYNQFYAGLKAVGQWELVGDPAEADLVLELRLTAPYGPSDPNKQKGASDPLPMLRLVVYDGKTHYVLWAMTETIAEANLQKSHDRNFDDAVLAIGRDFEALSGKTPAAAQ